MTNLALDDQDPPSLTTQITRMAGAIGAAHYATGERAALRRWAPGLPIPLAFYRLWLRHLGSDLPPEAHTLAWMTIAWGMANLDGTGHDAGRPFGQALAESGFAEGRLERLLSAPEDVRLELFMSAVRFLAAKNARFDWREAAQFLLIRDAAKRENLHRRIAQAYYRHQPHEAKE